MNRFRFKLLAITIFATALPAFGAQASVVETCQALVYEAKSAWLQRAASRMTGTDLDRAMEKLDALLFQFAGEEFNRNTVIKSTDRMTNRWAPTFRNWLEAKGLNPDPLHDEEDQQLIGYAIDASQLLKPNAYLTRTYPENLKIAYAPMQTSAEGIPTFYRSDDRMLLAQSTAILNRLGYLTTIMMSHEFIHELSMAAREKNNHRRFKFHFKMHGWLAKGLKTQLFAYATDFSSEEFPAYLTNVLFSKECARLTGDKKFETPQFLWKLKQMLGTYLTDLYPKIMDNFAELDQPVLLENILPAFPFKSIEMTLLEYPMDMETYRKNPAEYLRKIKQELEEEHTHLIELRNILFSENIDGGWNWLNSLGLPAEKFRPTREECLSFTHGVTP